MSIGGFYDHVPPPSAVPLAHHQEEWTFDRLGVQVPAILVSPFIKNGVNSKDFDHTSLLKYLTNKWNLGSLGERTANANSFADSISSQSRTDTPLGLTPPAQTPIQPVVLRTLTDHEGSMILARMR